MPTSTSPHDSRSRALGLRRSMRSWSYKLLTRTLALSQRLRAQINSTMVVRGSSWRKLSCPKSQARQHSPRTRTSHRRHLALRLHGGRSVTVAFFDRYKNHPVEKSTSITPPCCSRGTTRSKVFAACNERADRIARGAARRAPCTGSPRSQYLHQHAAICPRDAF